jgi:hypothetical protein
MKICLKKKKFLYLIFQVNFFIFTYFNRKFRRELARVCFHPKKKRNSVLRTHSRQSYVRTPQQNLQLFDVCIFRISYKEGFS